MRAVRFSVLMLMLLLLVISTASCAGGEPFDAGETLSASDVAALRDSLLGEQGDSSAQAPTPEEPSGSGDDVVQSGTVFWLSGGSVYHRDSDCRYIKEKQNVQSGTVTEATEAGKTRACSSCAAD